MASATCGCRSKHEALGSCSTLWTVTSLDAMAHKKPPPAAAAEPPMRLRPWLPSKHLQHAAFGSFLASLTDEKLAHYFLLLLLIALREQVVAHFVRRKEANKIMHPPSGGHSGVSDGINDLYPPLLFCRRGGWSGRLADSDLIYFDPDSKDVELAKAINDYESTDTHVMTWTQPLPGIPDHGFF